MSLKTAWGGWGTIRGQESHGPLTKILLLVDIFSRFQATVFLEIPLT